MPVFNSRLFQVAVVNNILNRMSEKTAREIYEEVAFKNNLPSEILPES